MLQFIAFHFFAKLTIMSNAQREGREIVNVTTKMFTVYLTRTCLSKILRLLNISSKNNNNTKYKTSDKHAIKQTKCHSWWTGLVFGWKTNSIVFLPPSLTALHRNCHRWQVIFWTQKAYSAPWTEDDTSINDVFLCLDIKVRKCFFDYSFPLSKLIRYYSIQLKTI